MPIHVRKLVDTDLLTIVKLLNEQFSSSYEFVTLDEKSLKSWIQEGSLEVLTAVERGVILGSTAYRNGRWGESIEWLATKKIADEEYIKTKLVENVEKLTKLGKISIAVDAGTSQVDEWVKRGYNHEDGLYHLIAKLNSLRQLPAIPDGICLRSLKPDEAEEFVEIVNKGFGWERLRATELQEWKTRDLPFDETWVQVAEKDGNIVSVVVAKPDTYYNESFHGKRGYLGPATTLPEWRRDNLASALTCRAMNFLYEKGMESVALYTHEHNVASINLLKKLEFEASHHWVFMKKTLLT